MQDLLKNPLYQQKDQNYINYVQGEFKHAFPGDVTYDETGQMIQAEPAIAPDQIRTWSQYQREQQRRNALIAGREAGAGSYMSEAISQPFLEADAQATLALELLGGNEPDYKAFDEKMKAIRERIPAGYRTARGIKQTQKIGKGMIKLATTLPPLAPVSAMQTAGETANQLARSGVSLNGQRIGAALTGISNLFGKGVTKNGLRKVNDMLTKRFGKDLRKMSPQELKAIGDTVLDEAWSIGPKGIVNKAYMGEKRKTEK